MAWSDSIDLLNMAVRDTFRSADPDLFTPASGDPSPFEIYTATYRLLRPDGSVESNFIVRWAKLSDFGEYIPAQGDLLALASGTSYLVEQVQLPDGGRDVILLLSKGEV